MTATPFESRILIWPSESPLLQANAPVQAPVVYWMQTAQRTRDNMALNYAADLAAGSGRPLVVIFSMNTSYPGANMRSFIFMIQGLSEVAEELSLLNIPFHVATTDTTNIIDALGPLACLVTERAYLRHLRLWRKSVATHCQAAGIPFIQIESEVLIPHHLVSDKQEYAAATIRRKITRQWLPLLYAAGKAKEHFMGPIKDYFRGQGTGTCAYFNEFQNTMGKLLLTTDDLEIACSVAGLAELCQARNLAVPDDSVPPSPIYEGGQASAEAQADQFFHEVFPEYGSRRNDPANPVQSNLSPWLHFGQYSVIRAAWTAVETARAIHQHPRQNPEAVPEGSLDAFLEEMIVRRELAKNFILHNSDYASYKGIPTWARDSLEIHRNDPRPVLYDQATLEKGETYDPYWNACQLEMVKTGKMHGYMRMYWGKKVLEWSATPEEAFETLVYLNDKYELDGRDENGYTGISWCFGTHDRGWKERQIFGKIRYMNDKGLERKFDIQAYAAKWLD